MTTRIAQNSLTSEEEFVSTASSWCASHGVLMGARDPETKEPLGNHVYEPAPFSLYPTPFPYKAFDKAYKLALPFNHIVHRAAQTYKTWLRPAITTASESDPDFTGKIVAIADEVIRKEAAGSPRAQRVALGIFRSDYMLHNDSENKSFDEAIPLQIELNTIASSFGCLSTKVTQLHKHLESLTVEPTQQKGDLPVNRASYGIAQGLAMAWQEYKRQRDEEHESKVKHHRAVVVMIVQPGETNACDQRDLEFLLQESHGIRLIRKTLAEINATGTMGVDGTSFYERELILPDGNDVVAAAVVYYRAGYTPDDYPTEGEWKARALIEYSSAIKSPDVFYHLVGAKKIQQALAEPKALRQFCKTDDEEQLVRSSFAGLYALGEDGDDEIVADAMANPQNYVLKPQREGGGNNLYDDELVEALQSMSFEERGAFILMQKILPPPSKGSLVRGGKVVYKGDCVCELGVFGVTLREYSGTGGKNDADEGGGARNILDIVAGHILRTKSLETDEGGVAAGYAFLSSPRVV